MKQAKVLSAEEMKRLLAVIEAGKHAARNRAAVMLSHLAGLRVGEIATLLIGDVYEADGKIREQIVLKAVNTKTKEYDSLCVRHVPIKLAEIITLITRMHIREEHEYLLQIKDKNLSKRL